MKFKYKGIEIGILKTMLRQENGYNMSVCLNENNVMDISQISLDSNFRVIGTEDLEDTLKDYELDRSDIQNIKRKLKEVVNKYTDGNERIVI